jgi:hypothetical protein
MAASVISARERIPLREGLEDLGRPDGGDVRGLGDPEDLLLHLRETLEPHLHRQVAARDQHPERVGAHADQEQPGKIRESRAGLDLQDDPGSTSAGPSQPCSRKSKARAPARSQPEWAAAAGPASTNGAS